MLAGLTNWLPIEENEIHVHFISFDHDTGQTAILATEHYPTFRHFYNEEKKSFFPFS